MDILTRRWWRTGRLVVVGAAVAAVGLVGGLVLLNASGAQRAAAAWLAAVAKASSR